MIYSLFLETHMYLYRKDRGLSILEKGITLDKAGDLIPQLCESAEIVNLSELWFSHLYNGTGERMDTPGCRENTRCAQYTACTVPGWLEQGPPPRWRGEHMRYWSGKCFYHCWEPSTWELSRECIYVVIFKVPLSNKHLSLCEASHSSQTMLPNSPSLNDFGETSHALFLLDLTSVYFLQLTPPKWSPCMSTGIRYPRVCCLRSHAPVMTNSLPFRLEVGSRPVSSDRVNDT